MGTKRCPRCELEKPHSEYHKNKTNKDGLVTYCKPCVNEYKREKWPNGKPQARARYFRQTYNLTLTELEQMKEAQGGLCAICGEVPKRAVVDHCHETGKVRGILCDTCNRCLGLMKDNVDVLMSAAAYLLQHEDVLASVGGE